MLFEIELDLSSLEGRDTEIPIYSRHDVLRRSIGKQNVYRTVGFVQFHPAERRGSGPHPPDSCVHTVWISKDRSLLLRQEQDIDLAGAAGKMHYWTRCEYVNASASPIH
jgi:hypothetical protein